MRDLYAITCVIFEKCQQNHESIWVPIGFKFRFSSNWPLFGQFHPMRVKFIVDFENFHQKRQPEIKTGHCLVNFIELCLNSSLILKIFIKMATDSRTGDART